MAAAEAELPPRLEHNDRDLEHFHGAMEAAKKAAADKSPAEIVDCSAKLLLNA